MDEQHVRYQALEDDRGISISNSKINGMRKSVFKYIVYHPCSLLCTAVFMICLVGCDLTPSKPHAPTPPPEQVLESKEGFASFYGPGLEGQKTASGEILDSKELTAAHPSYPMGTIIRVTNLESGDTVRVRVSDHGPTKKNRNEGVIIDLSKGAASKINMISEGRVRVKVEVLQWGKDSVP